MVNEGETTRSKNASELGYIRQDNLQIEVNHCVEAVNESVSFGRERMKVVPVVQEYSIAPKGHKILVAVSDILSINVNQGNVSGTDFFQLACVSSTPTGEVNSFR